MPLTFLSLTLNPSPSERDFITVRWKTASEVNVSHFNIQFSDNGKDFNTIGKIVAKNNSLNTYEFTHQSPTWGVRGLYRIEAVDFDGKKQYSITKQISTKPPTPNKVLVYPNPANNYITIETAEKINSIKIINAFGQVIRQLNTTNSLIDISYLAKGVYTISIITTKNELINSKIIKQ